MVSAIFKTFSSFSRLIKITQPHTAKYYKCVGSIPTLNIYHRNIFTHNVEKYQKISENKFKVKPGFGKINIEGNMDYIIKSANPHEYPDADHAIVTVYGLTAEKDLISIDFNDTSQDKLNISDNQSEVTAYCQIEVPIKYDINVNLKGTGGIHIENMESEEASINTEKGHLSTKGLKSFNLQFITNCGHLTSKGTLQGNLFVKANTTHIEAKRIQGLKMAILSNELSTNVDSSYVTAGLIDAHSGNIKLNNLHGSTNVALRKGSLKITGLRGQLSTVVDDGSIDVQVSDVWKESSIKLNTGSLTVSLAQNSGDHFEVTAPVLKVDSEISENSEETQNGNMKTFKRIGTNDQGCALTAEVNNGTAAIKSQDWFSTLGIKLRA